YIRAKVEDDNSFLMRNEENVEQRGGELGKELKRRGRAQEKRRASGIIEAKVRELDSMIHE
ncbi:hypothetical protein A2U01_0108606, partial [Trifolium medium]|nr:hypothetical protein [Trifolium medium]